jgi:hypothetical protein
VPADWPTRFLEYYAKHGTRWLAAKQAGVVYETVLRFEHADPAFAREVENARQEFADSQEQRLRKIGQKGNPVGPIVLLKKHRPGEYVEKNMTVSASFTGTLNPEDGKALLQAMLGHAPEAPLPPPGPDPTRGVLDGEPGGPESAQPSE